MNLQEFASFLSTIDNVIIFTHERPDGDALGSVFALLRLFRENGKRADAILPDPMADKYKQFIPDGGVLDCAPGKQEYSYCICLDAGVQKRVAMGDGWTKDPHLLPVVNIDHHPDNPLYGNENYVDPSASSTAEILFNLFEKCSRVKLSKESLEAILIGILTDTGGLRFDNTSSRTLGAVARIIEKGANYSRIMRAMFFTKPYNLLQLESDISLNELNFAFDKRYVYFYLSDQILKKYDITKEETEGLVDTIRTIDGVDVIALISQRNSGCKVSLRSNNTDLPIAGIARKFHGGGHELAAGCFFPGETHENVEKILVHEVTNFLTLRSSSLLKLGILFFLAI